MDYLDVLIMLTTLPIWICQVHQAQCAPVESLSVDEEAIFPEEAATPLSSTDLHWDKEQSLDPTISRVITLLRKGHKLTARQCSLVDPLVKRLLREWDKLVLCDGCSLPTSGEPRGDSTSACLTTSAEGACSQVTSRRFRSSRKGTYS